jgi:mannuronan 5-epimerase
MGRKQILIAIVAASITGPWPVSASAAEQPLDRPALASLPDLDSWVRILDGLDAPPRQPGAVAIRPAQQEPALRGSFQDAARAMSNWGGEALVVERGIHTLEALASAANRPDLLHCQSDGCELRAPLVVKAGAGLVIEGSPKKPLRFRLVQEAGALVVNAGILHIEWASILGWSASEQALAETSGERFRPFIAAYGGSETAVLRSELHHLGFQEAKAYGFALSSHARLFPGEQPSARIFASRFHQLYYGFYTYEARSFVLIASVFSGSHRYGIDPHDASSQLLIARNEIHGTEGHGLVLSKDVHDSWIVENLSRNNARSGLVVDASSTRNIIAGNRLIDNHGDGIAIFESHENAISFNTIEGNGGAGIRIRASAANLVANNTISGSGEYGLLAYDWSDIARPLTPEQEKSRRPVSLTLVGNSFADNARGACRFKSVAEVIAYADSAGDLKPCGEPLSILGGQTPNPSWRRIPGRPEAARLVLEGD